MPKTTKKNLFLDRESMHVDDYETPVTNHISGWLKDMKLIDENKSVKEIRKYVRNVLLESARVNAALAQPNAYGLVMRDNTAIPPTDGNMAVLMIFNIDSFFDNFDPDIDVREDDIWDEVEAALYEAGSAMIAYRRAGEKVVGKRHAGLSTGPCFGGFEIQRLASRERGFSWPLRSIVLDIANQEGTGFFADRESVSDEAKLGYARKMSNYGRRKFDNVLDPKTPDPTDDCLLYSDIDPSAESLDYLYVSEAGLPPYFDILNKNTDLFYKKLISLVPRNVKRKFKFNLANVKKWFNGYGGSGVALDIFGDRYDTGGEE